MSSLVFISYSRNDKAKAKELHKWIQEEVGFPVFFDTSSIKVGHTWKALITNSLDSCFAVVVLLSLKAAESNYVTYEWSYAMGKGKKIIPLVIDVKLERDKINEFLKDTQYAMEFIHPTSEDWIALKNRLIELKELSDIPVEVLRGADLARDPIPENRAAGIKMLENYAHEAALRELRMFALDNAWGDRQIDAALALGRKTSYHDEAAIKGLERAISERKYQLKDEAKDHLMQMNSLPAAEAFYRCYEIVEEFEKENIVIRLSNFTNRDIAPVLLRLAQKEDTPHLLTLYQKLAEFGEETVINPIYESIVNNKFGFQGNQRAINILALYKTDSAIQSLYDLYIKSEHGQQNLAQQILGILAKSGQEKALNLLENHLQNPQVKYAQPRLREVVNQLKAQLK